MARLLRTASQPLALQRSFQLPCILIQKRKSSERKKKLHTKTQFLPDPARKLKKHSLKKHFQTTFHFREAHSCQSASCFYLQSSFLESSQVDWLGLLLQYVSIVLGKNRGVCSSLLHISPIENIFLVLKNTLKPQNKIFPDPKPKLKKQPFKLQKQHFKFQKQHFKLQNQHFKILSNN